MLHISSGDVLIGASLSRNTRKQPAVAHAQLTDDSFAACLCPLRGALPEGETRFEKKKTNKNKLPRMFLRCTILPREARPA